MPLLAIELNKLPPDTLALLSALIGGAAAALISAIASAVERRFEAKRQSRDLAIRSGLDAWRHQAELGISLVNQGRTDSYQQPAPEPFICHMLRVIEIASDTDLTAREAAKRISEMKGR